MQIKPKFLRRLLLIGVILFAVFAFSGGFSAVSSYLFGATSYSEYRMSTLVPLYAGGLLMGSFGLMFAYKNRGSAVCLVGFGITVFCYGFIEYLVQAVGVI